MDKLFLFKVSAVLLMAACLVSPVFAGWSGNLDQSGTWLSVDRTVWANPQSGDSGQVSWRYLNVSGFCGYEANLNMSWLVCSGAPWWNYFLADKYLDICWNFSTVYVYTAFQDQISYNGWIHNEWVFGGVGRNNSGFSDSWADWWDNKALRDHIDFKTDSVRVILQNVSSTVLWVRVFKVCGFGSSGSDVLLASANYTVGSGWFSSVDISLKIWYGGNGYFRGGFE